MERVLTCVELRSKNVLLNMKNSTKATRNSSLRHAAILKVKEDKKSHLLQIVGYLPTKYKLEGIVRSKGLRESQMNALYNEI